MKDKLTISISTVSGSKHWQLSKWICRSLKGLISINIVAVLGGGALIHLLVQALEQEQTRQKHAVTESRSLAGQVEALRELNNTLEDNLYIKESEIQQLIEVVDNAQDKQRALLIESKSKEDQLADLNSLKRELENDLAQREEHIALVSDRLSDLELVLGVSQPNEGQALESRLDTAAIYYNVRKELFTQIPSGSPVGERRISSQFGERVHPVTKKLKMHRGLDFAVNVGTSIYATADGVVEATKKSNKGLGNFLRVQHSFGFSSSYSHLNSFNVKVGQFVQKGDLIAISGNTGLSSGPHLHYEVRFLGRALDPKPFVEWNMNKFEHILTEVRVIKWESLITVVEQRVAQRLQHSSPEGVMLTDNSK
ncbi:Murein DD-endopeptidase MepM [Vibrio thalassae]|uniref:Murein DD-endopeptidase MepM n=1 Tax=Vibrio thalassae TaxID=1243014 RepID=A0A240ELU8_9VIBR|nr:M23 family metallopeptidase [Vibrio thalassae]SNX49596.1 Murein DD-endopeptidase MepM [Vibrio thalassae]